MKKQLSMILLAALAQAAAFAAVIPAQKPEPKINNQAVQAETQIRPLVLKVGDGNKVTGTLDFSTNAKDGVITDGEAQWRLKTVCAPASDRPYAKDYEFTWTLEKGIATRSAVAVEFPFRDNWSEKNYVLCAAAVYNGNRFKYRNIPWPHYLLYCDPKEQRLDQEVMVNDAPRLKQTGAGRIDLTTGGLATPLLGFHAPGTQRGWMVMTTQGDRLGNHGLCIEENAGHTAASFMITSPAIRHTRAGGSELIAPSGDKPADWKVGDSATIKCRVYEFPAVTVNEFLQRFYQVRKDLNPSVRNETLPFSAARQLLESLYNHHRWDEKAGLFRLNDPGQTRMVQIWQLGWVGGGQVTLPLLQFGDRQTSERAMRNLETIFTKSQAKSGFFYSTGDGKVFVSDKFRPQMPDGLILLRKNADWLYMAQRQFQVIEAKGETVSIAWKDGLRRQADAFVRIWRKYGQLGHWADVETGELKVGGTSGPAIACGGLALASKTFKDPTYLAVAEEAARKYRKEFVQTGISCGGPAEGFVSPESESTFGLFESFMTLYEVTGNREWLQASAEVIPLCASWTESYDFVFPQQSSLGKAGVRAAGAVWAGVSNKHASPGICTWSGDALLKYYRATGDRLALDLLADIAHGISQYISRQDLPIGGMKPGGICERVNTNDWEGAQNIGGNIFSSCSWIETASLLTFAQVPSLYVRPDLGELTVFDHLTAEKLPSVPGTIKLKITNPTKFPAEVRVLVETAEERKKPMPLLNDKKIRTLHLDAGASVEVSYGLTPTGTKVTNGRIGVAETNAPLRFIFNMIHDNPGEKPFKTKYRDPLLLKEYGYNGKVMKSFPQTALTYDAFDPEVMPQGSTERAWAEAYGKTVDHRIAAAKAAGMPIYNFTDLLVVPEKLLVKYGNEMTVGKGNVTKEIIEENRKNAIHGSLTGTGKRLSVTRSMTQKLIKVQLDELFTRFPGLDGLFIRFGETYLHDTPYHVGGSPVGGGVEEHRILIKLLREEVCVKRNKKVFYRTWGWDGFLTNPDTYHTITDSIEPHTNLIFSIKHSNGDFYRGVPFNKTLGVGNHQQIVEISCNQAGLYGKCAYPYYIGRGVIDHWDTEGEKGRGLCSLLGNKNIVGVWTWSHGDGWAGPHKTNELWTDLNAAVIVKYAQQPGRPEPEIFDEYCRDKLKLDTVQTAKFRELCLLATNATFHGQESDYVDGSSWWCRDEYLTAIDLSGVVARRQVDQVLAEKAKAVADWKRVEQMAREIMLNNPADQEFMEVSCTYGRIKMAITEQIWTLQILAEQAKISGTPDKPAMAKAIKAYDDLWAEWRKLKEDHACCPTLYCDDKAVFCGPPFMPSLDRYRNLVK
jgi:hypothetical protein